MISRPYYQYMNDSTKYQRFSTSITITWNIKTDQPKPSTYTNHIIAYIRAFKILCFSMRATSIMCFIPWLAIYYPIALFVHYIDCISHGIIKILSLYLDSYQLLSWNASSFSPIPASAVEEDINCRSVHNSILVNQDDYPTNLNIKLVWLVHFIDSAISLKDNFYFIFFAK